MSKEITLHEDDDLYYIDINKGRDMQIVCDSKNLHVVIKKYLLQAVNVKIVSNYNYNL